MAAAFNSSLEINHRVLELYPNALTSPSKPHGRYPLHEAVWFANSTEVVNFYLKAYPQAAYLPTSEGSTPLHFLLETPHLTQQRMDCLRLLLKTNSAAVLQADNDGETPLSITRRHRHGNQVLRLLFRAVEHRNVELDRELRALNWSARRGAMLVSLMGSHDNIFRRLLSIKDRNHGSGGENDQDSPSPSSLKPWQRTLSFL